MAIGNLIEQEDMAKGLPDDVLLQEAQQPSGQLPQFLLISEVQRRTDMRKRYQLQMQEMEPTVAEQIMQEGIAGVAQPPPEIQQAMNGGPPPMQPPMNVSPQPMAIPPPMAGPPQQPPIQMAYQGGVVGMQDGSVVPGFGRRLESGYSINTNWENAFQATYGVTPDEYIERGGDSDVVERVKEIYDERPALESIAGLPGVMDPVSLYRSAFDKTIPPKLTGGDRAAFLSSLENRRSVNDKAGFVKPEIGAGLTNIQEQPINAMIEDGEKFSGPIEAPDIDLPALRSEESFKKDRLGRVTMALFSNPGDLNKAIQMAGDVLTEANKERRAEQRGGATLEMQKVTMDKGIERFNTQMEQNILESKNIDRREKLRTTQTLIKFVLPIAQDKSEFMSEEQKAAWMPEHSSDKTPGWTMKRQIEDLINQFGMQQFGMSLDDFSGYSINK